MYLRTLVFAERVLALRIWKVAFEPDVQKWVLPNKRSRVIHVTGWSIS